MMEMECRSNLLSIDWSCFPPLLFESFHHHYPISTAILLCLRFGDSPGSYWSIELEDTFSQVPLGKIHPNLVMAWRHKGADWPSVHHLLIHWHDLSCVQAGLIRLLSLTRQISCQAPSEWYLIIFTYFHIIWQSKLILLSCHWHKMK